MDEKIPLTDWEKEEIPDIDPSGKYYFLYRHIHQTYIKVREPERISPSAFKDEDGEGISTDWSKYSSVNETQKRSINKPSREFGVVSLVIKEIRKDIHLKELSIEHNPLQKTATFEGNRAHTDIQGILKYGRSYRKNEAQVHLARIAKWEINNKLNSD